MISRAVVFAFLSLSSFFCAAAENIAVIEVPLTKSVNPVSLFGDDVADLVLNTRNAGHGTMVGGTVEFFLNRDRVDRDCDWDDRGITKSESKFHAKMDWSDSLVSMQSFSWETHVGDVWYHTVYLYQKYRDSVWVGTYVIAPELVQSPHAESLNDTKDATMTLHIYGLVNIDNSGQGTGPCRSILFMPMPDKKPSRVTGQPDELKKEFAAIIKKLNDLPPH